MNYETWHNFTNGKRRYFEQHGQWPTGCFIGITVFEKLVRSAQALLVTKTDKLPRGQVIVDGVDMLVVGNHPDVMEFTGHGYNK